MRYLHKPSQGSKPVNRRSHLSSASPLSYFKCRGRKEEIFFNMQKAPDERTNSNESFGLNYQFSHHLVIAFSLKCGFSLARQQIGQWIFINCFEVK